MSGFSDLLVYQKARMLNQDIYRLVRRLPSEERYAMADQLRRASISIGANIAEGNGRGSTKDYIHFLYIARGSAYELESELLYCMDTALADREVLQRLLEQTVNVCRLLSRLIASLERKSEGSGRVLSEEVEPYEGE